MYNDHYGSKIEPDNVMIFAGGRCAIFTVLLFLKKAETKMQNLAKLTKTKRYLVKQQNLKSTEDNKAIRVSW